MRSPLLDLCASCSWHQKLRPFPAGLCSPTTCLVRPVSHTSCLKSPVLSCSVVSDSLRPRGLQPAGDSPGKNTGVSCHALLQGIFPTQGLNPSLPTLQVDSLPAEPPGKPKNTGVGSLAFLQGSSRPQNQTGVSCTAGRFFTS